jgi:hypothetical protein
MYYPPFITKERKESMQVSNFKLGIAFPLSFPMVPAPFLRTIMLLERPTFTFFQSTFGPIDELRNQLVEEALQARCSHLIMMDTDMTYHPKTITKLLEHNLDVVGALCYQRYPPFNPIMLKGAINSYKIIEQWEPDSLVEVDATGTGCLLFNMDVFKKMPAPWFKFRPNPDPDKVGWVGEDIGFCSDMRAAGYRIFVDTSVPSGHLSTLEVNHETWRLYSTVSEKKKEVMNRKMAELENGELFERPL